MPKTNQPDDLVRRLRQHALPDPHDEREVLYGPLFTEAADAIERLQRSTNPCREQTAYLSALHTGMKISASGILGRIRDGRYYRELNYGCGVLLQHLEQMASRFYAGEVSAVDEFLQLYCLDDARPETTSKAEP